ncbi:DUF935 family protein [Nannocystis pusilla]|uniref:DUF935 family protein n=1 Tax=Nannocystis pusilla TaxID=889268 RepID=A0A9X3EHY1_9BACT|nr:DUF935 family protein [Nannocystis pusilla]
MGVPWIVEAASDDKRDKDIASELQAIVDDDIWTDLVMSSLDALLKGYAVTEITWNMGARWTPASFTWRDPRSFALDLEDGATIRLRTDAQPKLGEDLDPFKYVVHAPALVSGPIAAAGLVRPLSVLYVLKTQGVRAWLTYMELYGIPLRLGKYPARDTSEDEIAKLWEALVAIGEDGAGIMPAGMSIEVLDAIGKGGGSRAHQDLADWCDRQASKVIVGQTMTADDGASLSQAKVHDDVRRDYVVADARALAATLRRDFIIPFCKINYGELAVYPKLRAQTDEPEDRKVFVESLVPMIDRGLEVEASVVADRLGLPVPDKGAKVLRPMNRAAPAAAADADEADADEAKESPAESSKQAIQGRGRARCQKHQLADSDDGDFIDREATPDDWRSTMKPLHDAAKAAAAEASGFADFLSRLSSAQVDGDKLVRSLALKTLQARGVGDATDEVT